MTDTKHMQIVIQTSRRVPSGCLRQCHSCSELADIEIVRTWSDGTLDEFSVCVGHAAETLVHDTHTIVTEEMEA